MQIITAQLIILKTIITHTSENLYCSNVKIPAKFPHLLMHVKQAITFLWNFYIALKEVLCCYYSRGTITSSIVTGLFQDVPPVLRHNSN